MLGFRDLGPLVSQQGGDWITWFFVLGPGKNDRELAERQKTARSHVSRIVQRIR